MCVYQLIEVGEGMFWGGNDTVYVWDRAVHFHCTVKKGNDFSVHIPGQGEFGKSVTSRLGTGKSVTFFTMCVQNVQRRVFINQPPPLNGSGLLPMQSQLTNKQSKQRWKKTIGKVASHDDSLMHHVEIQPMRDRVLWVALIKTGFLRLLFVRNIDFRKLRFLVTTVTIIGHQFNKRLESFVPCYSQSLLLEDFLKVLTKKSAKQENSSLFMNSLL